MKKKEFLRSLIREGECLVWRGCTDKDGYGLVNFKGRTVRAHRLAYRLAYREDPGRLSVLHTCDTPACCEPTHLFRGTQKTNIRDMASKGRHGKIKFSHVEVLQIRERAAQGELQKSIAAELGVSKSCISKIVNHKQRIYEH